MRRALSITGILLGIGILSVVLATHAPAWARGWGGGGWGGPGGCPGYGAGTGPGYGPGALSEEQSAKMDELYQSHYDETAQMRNDLRAKRAELNRLVNSPEPDREKILALQKEVNDLRSVLSEKRTDFMLKAREIAPDYRFAGRGGRGYSNGYDCPAWGQGAGKRAGYDCPAWGQGGGKRGGCGRPNMRGYGYGPGMGQGGYGPGACWQ